MSRINFSTVFDIMRQNDRPMTSAEIADEIARQRGEAYTNDAVSGVLSRHMLRAEATNSRPLVYRVQRGVYGITARGKAHVEAAKPDTEQTLTNRIVHRPVNPDLSDSRKPSTPADTAAAKHVPPVIPVEGTLVGHSVQGETRTPIYGATVTPHIIYRLMAEVDEHHVLLKAPSGTVYLAKLKRIEL